MKQYVDVFPREQLHILLFEDLQRRPVETTQEIFRFLGVDPTFKPAVKRENPSLLPASIRIQHMLADRWRMHPLRSAKQPGFVDRRVIPFLFSCNLAAGAWRKMSLNPETERHLLERYRTDIERTAELIGRDLDSWLKPGAAANRAA